MSFSEAHSIFIWVTNIGTVKLLNVKSALIGTQAARALVLLEKEGVQLIHGQSATGHDTLLHLGEVGIVEQTAVLHVIHHERLQLGLDGLCIGSGPTPRRPDRPRDRPLGIPKGDACRSAFLRLALLE